MGRWEGLKERGGKRLVTKRLEPQAQGQPLNLLMEPCSVPPGWRGQIKRAKVCTVVLVLVSSHLGVLR